MIWFPFAAVAAIIVAAGSAWLDTGTRGIRPPRTHGGPERGLSS
jgi:hypothetical protein